MVSTSTDDERMNVWMDESMKESMKESMNEYHRSLFVWRGFVSMDRQHALTGKSLYLDFVGAGRKCQRIFFDKQQRSPAS
jgi:hypothetical protein